MNPSLGHPRLQSLILRAACLMSLLTLGAVFAPEYVLGKLNWFLGFGKLPDSVLLRYLGSGGSFVAGRTDSSFRTAVWNCRRRGLSARPTRLQSALASWRRWRVLRA